MSVFECRMCGNCCEGRGGIILAGKDLRRLAGAFGMTDEAFLAEYAEFMHGKYTVRLGDDGRCVFFRAGIGCTVHAVKPDVCRAWPFFRGNMIDPVSLHMAKDFCPGIEGKATYAEFVAEGRRYLRENGLVAHDPTKEGNALLSID